MLHCKTMACYIILYFPVMLSVSGPSVILGLGVSMPCRGVLGEGGACQLTKALQKSGPHIPDTHVDGITGLNIFFWLATIEKVFLGKPPQVAKNTGGH